jgi:hypothetical protein
MRRLVGQTLGALGVLALTVTVVSCQATGRSGKPIVPHGAEAVAAKLSTAKIGRAQTTRLRTPYTEESLCRIALVEGAKKGVCQDSD